MPKFPTYRGELPKCLNPLNPRHWFLLAYWAFFRPTALKCYLYQADPELYRSGRRKDFFGSWRIATYRNLFVATSITGSLLFVAIGLPSMLLVSYLQGTSVPWLLHWSFLGVFIETGILMGGLAFLGGGILGRVDDVMTSVVFAMVLAVCLGGMLGVLVGVLDVRGDVEGGMADALGAMLDVVADDMVWGVMLGILAGMAVGMMINMLVGSKGKVTGVLLGVMFGVSLGLYVLVGMGVLEPKKSTMPVVEDVQNFIAGEGGIRIGVVGVGIIIGGLRLVFYPFQFALALCSGFQRVRHPLEWDEMTILPLPRTRKVLTQKIQQDEGEGLCLLADVARNPFRRLMMQKVLYHHLHAHKSPFQFLYHLLIMSDLKEYVITPANENQWKLGISVHCLFLRKLALSRFPFVNIPLRKKVDYITDHLFDWFVWLMNYRLRGHCHSPLTNFAGMLYELLDIEDVEAEKFTLSSYAGTYRNLLSYPGGREIAQTFDTIATFLSYTKLSDLPESSETRSNFVFDDPIRPTVLKSLCRLGEVGQEIATYQDSTSRSNKLAALARATDALKDLNEYVQAEVMAPEQYLLRRIIRQWQQLIIEAGGELGRVQITGPVANPYVAGNPVTGELFVGREDILRRLEELWSGSGQKPSVVLYGHRRMGKSSILHNLGARFGKDTVIVDFNMQRVGLVESTGELLYNLGLAMYDMTHPYPSQGGIVTEPEEGQFLNRNPYTAFDRFLKQVDRMHGKRRFIVTVDEFELIEQKIKDGKLDAQLLDFWRGVIQTYPWFVMAFAGLHTLKEMREDYWNPLFGSVTGIPVSFLKPGAARKLITQPSLDFDLDYDADAIEAIISLTHGQPYLIQLICHSLVTRFNRQSFEQGVERERRFSLADVESAINTPELFRDGNAYFTGVWKQAENYECPGQQEVLRKLAPSEAGLSVEELVQSTGLPQNSITQSLKVLTRHDVVVEIEGKWRFTVELMRRWVGRKT